MLFEFCEQFPWEPQEVSGTRTNVELFGSFYFFNSSSFLSVRVFTFPCVSAYLEQRQVKNSIIRANFL